MPRQPNCSLTERARHLLLNEHLSYCRKIISDKRVKIKSTCYGFTVRVSAVAIDSIRFSITSSPSPARFHCSLYPFSRKAVPSDLGAPIRPPQRRAKETTIDDFL